MYIVYVHAHVSQTVLYMEHGLGKISLTNRNVCMYMCTCTYYTVIHFNFVRKIFELENFIQQSFRSYQTRAIYNVYAV